uniref:Uncharacterized protein n=1 Tax=Globisporangium ultimum (strain ATCC 200006 / CBS 805.95 / DAOM BR144) TaxID=431595 RepID=K3WL13_GLOUD
MAAKHMSVDRTLLDKDFDRYVLSTAGVEKQTAALPTSALVPLSAVQTVRKAQWDARVHYNALVADPFLSQGAKDGEAQRQRSVAYYVSAEFELMQVIFSEVEGLKVQKLLQFTLCTSRDENASLQVAGRGLIAYSDGHGELVLVKSDGDPLNVNSWRILYECKPLGSSASTLLLGASFDEVSQQFHVLVTELIDYNDKDAVYRLHAISVYSAAAKNAMDADVGGVVGLQHTATEIAVLASLPSYVSFTGSEALVLVEGKHELMVELSQAPSDAAMPDTAMFPPNAELPHVPHKRHHDESDFDDELGELLAKLPRAGIGYQGDVSERKHSQDLALDIHEKPLEERFQKSSTPFSTLDEPLHSAPDDSARNAAERLAREGAKFEAPTPDSILGGFEECDDVDPNATAAVVRVQLASDNNNVVVQAKYDINCRKFRFLCQSARTPAAFANDTTFLFQNDVHGVIFQAVESASDAEKQQVTLVHTATLPAFGFVQASKQEKKFMTFHATGAFACIGEFEKRLFIYHGAPSDAEEAKLHTCKQHVVELGDHQLLGLRVTNDRTILVLTAHHIVAITVPV